MPADTDRRKRDESMLLTLALWHEGFTDAEIKAVIGHVPTQERRRLGLLPNRKCGHCEAPIPPYRRLCDEHRVLEEDRDSCFYVARTVLWGLSECIGDEYHHARRLALVEWPWLADSVERWEAEGRVGPVPVRKSNGRPGRNH